MEPSAGEVISPNGSVVSGAAESRSATERPSAVPLLCSVTAARDGEVAVTGVGSIARAAFTRPPPAPSVVVLKVASSGDAKIWVESPVRSAQ